MSDWRKALAERPGRVVVKIGSSVLTDEAGHIRPKVIRRLADEIAPLITPRRWPFVVSSGAIAVGVGELGLPERPQTMAGLQAAAAVGQSKLVETWAAAFRRFDTQVGQVLLTHADLADRKRYLNARHALLALKQARVVPIINENDSVSYKEIALGDNDELAAQVCNLVDAQLLVMLSVAPGILDEGGRCVPEVAADDPRLDAWVRPSGSRFGRGGMASKIRAARAATDRGSAVVILDGTKQGNLQRLLAGEEVGTLLTPPRESHPLSSRAHWILHSLRPQGRLLIDAGACRAIEEGKTSLLGRGVLSVEGDFLAGDAVEITSEAGEPLARGLSRYTAEDLRQIAGLPSDAIQDKLGHFHGPTVVHRDDLVMIAAHRSEA